MEDRQQVIERLLAAHEAWFDVERDHEFAGRTFPGYAEFHSTATKYVLVKRAKLWEASAHEYLFFCETPHLDAVTLNELVSFMTSEALAKVQLGPDHMSSYLSLVVVADTVDTAASRQVRATRFRKNFSFGFRGWADLRLAVIDLSQGRVHTNGQGKALKETLATNAFVCAVSPEQERGRAAGETASGDGPSHGTGDLATEPHAARVSSE
ncbi:hypothetical protein [uncultured Adlercreutzia sp.]|uniref:hypothetical protein n=1 Tax=uncultured Adlercreutzia sp. TaxID=875803 RepID=UPI0026F3B069|nr:hypothetical protein [uncultured Adlercreutzia sp.]